MIYTKKQLDDAKQSAEQAGWQTHLSGDGKGIEYINFWKADSEGNVKRYTERLSPWLVDELNKLLREEAPRVEKPIDRFLEAAQSIDWVQMMRNEAIKSCAAGPWKAWPENNPEGGRMYLVNRKRKDGSIILTCAYWIVTSTQVNGTFSEWISTISRRRLRGVTHFAELNTEAP